MDKWVTILFYLCIIPYSLHSQTFPKEGAALNYRLVGFSYPVKKEVGNYKIEISAGYYQNEDSFRKNIVLTVNCKTNKTIAEVPSFGGAYTWRVVYKNALLLSKKSVLWHFTVKSVPEADTGKFRLRVLKNNDNYKNAYIISDGSRTIYDMNGNPLWVLPDKDGTDVRDMKITPQGTITFLNREKIYEINYNGDILWKGPNTGAVNGDTAEHYHHEFTRLDNGNYMVLGNELPIASSNGIQDSTVLTDAIPYGTLIEYNEKGNITWSWKAFPWFKESDLKYYKNGKDKNFKKNNAVNVHENAFFFDERSQLIYLGFRNISRILKIKYPEGNVIDTYGEVYKPNVSATGNNLFCGQHSISVTQKGYLLLFNNNSCKDYSLPELLMLNIGQDHIKTVWAYECVIDSVSEDRQKQNPFGSGGNVIELPDQSLFAYMSGGNYSRLFIVNLDKEILWSGSFEKWDTEEKKWKALLQYRANIITSTQDLERLIWHE